MDITPIIDAGRQLIQGYGDLGFTISGTRHNGSVIVFPSRAISWAGELSPSCLEAVIAAEDRPEILLVGCGRSMAPLPRELKSALRAAGIIAEPMDTGAACRTYNILLAEERRVAAALIAV